MSTTPSRTTVLPANVGAPVRTALKYAVASITSTAEERQIAFDAARSAEADLFQLVIAELVPALPVLSSRLVIASLQEPRTSAVDTFDESRRGVLLAGDASPRRNKDGSYTGKALYCLESGELLRVTYSGTWSTEGDAVTGAWKATTADLSFDEAVREWRFGDVCERIAAALQQAEDGNRKAAAALMERTDRVRAVTTLLRR